MPIPSVRHLAILGLTGVLSVLAACADGPSSEAGWAGSVDTLATGRVVVRSPDVPLDSGWTLREEFRLGSLDGDGPDLFGQVVGLELGTGGEVHVLDGQSSPWSSTGRRLG